MRVYLVFPRSLAPAWQMVALVVLVLGGVVLPPLAIAFAAFGLSHIVLNVALTCVRFRTTCTRRCRRSGDIREFQVRNMRNERLYGLHSSESPPCEKATPPEA